MKKIIALLLACMMVFGLTACGNKPAESTPAESTPAESTLLRPLPRTLP